LGADLAVVVDGVVLWVFGGGVCLLVGVWRRFFLGFKGVGGGGGGGWLGRVLGMRDGRGETEVGRSGCGRNGLEGVVVWMAAGMGGLSREQGGAERGVE